MNVLLLCDKAVPELFPLMGELPVAQLPLLGKTIVEYHLELVCAVSEPQKLWILGGNYQNSLQVLLGDGARWGVDLDYKKTLSRQQDFPLLVLPCDRLSSFDMVQFLRYIQEHPQTSVVGMIDGTPAVYWITRQEEWCEVVGGELRAAGIGLELPLSAIRVIDSISAFYDTNMGLLRGDFQHVNIGAYYENESLLLASRAQVSSLAQHKGRTYVGTASRIGENVVMTGLCAVGQHVLVDDNAMLEDCVILPNSYVGNWVSIRNAVVSGSLVWRMDTGICLNVNEHFLLSQLPVSGGGNWLSRWLERVRKSLRLITNKYPAAKPGNLKAQKIA